MNNNKLWFLCLALLLSVVACTNDNEIKINMPNAAQLVSSTPTNGQSIDTNGDLNVVLQYDQYVFCPNCAKNVIQIEGANVVAASSEENKLTIQLSGLTKGNTYTLVVPNGAVWGPAKVDIPEVKISFTTNGQSTISPELVTPNALSAAQKVFDYMISIYGKQSLSGTMANVAWNIDGAEKVYTLTGKYPAMTHFDYIHLWASPANWIDYSDTQLAENWWNDGGIIGASWHWMVPKSENGASDDLTYDPTQTTFSVNNALTEGTWENKIMNDDLAKMAGYLKLLQDKGIPVVWRPLHEAAGNTYEFTGGSSWFWWGRDGAQAYKNLWVYMFDFFKAQGLNNLIWVWTSQTKDADFYPGDNYVDIIARDMYGKDATESYADFTSLNNTFGNKMLCLGENGAYIDNNKAFANFSDLWNSGSKWLFFMPWYDNEDATMQHAPDSWWNDAISNPNVVTRDELPAFK